MKAFKFNIFGNDYAVQVHDIDGQTIRLEVNGSEYTVVMEKEVKSTKTPTLVRSQPKVVSAPTENTLTAKSSIRKATAPLPGVIMEVKVKVGDSVKTGDVLLIMEAMKMENNILAENSGSITSLNVKQGDTVLQGDILLEIS